MVENGCTATEAAQVGLSWPRDPSGRNLRIVTAAAQAAAVNGYHGLNMRHVAEATGVSTATIYRHFPSKPRLVLAVFGRCLEEFDAVHAVGPSTVADPRERLQQLVADLFAALYCRRLLADAAARAYALADASAAEQVEGVRLHLTDLFAEALGGEDFTPEDAAIGSLLCDVWLAGMVRI